ncbi:MAG: hypothetical protein IT475_15610 [Aquimonas sp.]|nr:hypothetical protein [Aquimonas sp.]
MKTFKLIAILSLMVLLINGCGNSANSVNSVKGATLSGREQTTVGNAFDAFFNESSWELKESANKTQFVEFTGKTKEQVPFNVGGLPVDGEGVLVIPEGGNVMVQFILKIDGTFEIGNVEATIKANPSLSERTAMIVRGSITRQGIKTDGSTLSIQGEFLNAFLDRIYSN